MKDLKSLFVLACVLILQACTSASDVVMVQIRTSMGVIQVAIDTLNAPVTATNFLRYVDDGLFDGGSFFRTVRDDNQPTDSIRIAVIQGGANPEYEGEFFDAIPLERTSVTGLMHTDGAISMARDGPDTAKGSFFICIEDQPELDFGGMRNPDGQGFAVFGRVTEGMDVVRRIQMEPVERQTLTPTIEILSVERVK